MLLLSVVVGLEIQVAFKKDGWHVGTVDVASVVQRCDATGAVSRWPSFKCLCGNGTGKGKVGT